MTKNPVIFSKKISALNNNFIIRIPSDLKGCFSKGELVEITVKFINIDENNEVKNKK